METSGLPEPLRARMAELDGMSPLETVRRFLGGYVADAESLDEIRADLEQLAQTSTGSIRRNAAAIETLLAEPPSPPGTLARLVGSEGNWVLEDPSDAGAAAFLRDLARLLRTAIDEAESQRTPP
jgi:hypothetical protein